MRDGIYLGERRRWKLVYAGKVEHGFTDAHARHLKAGVRELDRPS